jgi:hypothetical protein
MIFLKALSLVVVVAIGAAIGFGAALVYTGVSGSATGMSTACHVLTTAERRGIITKTQSLAIMEDAWISIGRKSRKVRSPETDAEDLKLTLDYIRDDCRY